MPIPGGSLVLLNKKRGETDKLKSEKKADRLRDDKNKDIAGAAGALPGYGSPSHKPRSGHPSPCHQSRSGQASPNHQSRSGQASPSYHHTSPRHSLQQNSFSFFGRSPSGQQLASPSRSALAAPRRSHQGLQVSGSDEYTTASGNHVSPKSSPKLPRLRGHSKSTSPRRKDNQN